MNGKSGSDAERGTRYEESQLVDTVRPTQPRKFSITIIDRPSPDYMKWSTASIFICFLWGILAFRASNKVRKYNSMKAYNEASYYSRTALRHNQSAVACLVILLFILGLPLAISLAVQVSLSKILFFRNLKLLNFHFFLKGSITKFPSAREFFG